MAFGDDLRIFADKVERRLDDVFTGSVIAVSDSVVEGSPTTGAPGQPVDIGNLKASWQTTFPDRHIGEVSTNVEYAPAIEEGQQPPYTTASGTRVTPRPMVLRSRVGGFHSVAQTRLNWDRIVDAQVREVVP